MNRVIRVGIATARLHACAAALIGWMTCPASALEVIEFEPSKSAKSFAIHPTSGEIYAAEADRLSVYDPTGVLLRSFGELPPQPSQERDIRVNGQGHVLVKSRGLWLFNAQGGLETTMFNWPDGLPLSSAPVALGPDGRIFIARRSNLDDQIHVFTPQGVPERSFLLPSRERPRQGIALDFGADGLLYVASERRSAGAVARSIEVLDTLGQPQRNIALGETPAQTNVPGLFGLDLRVAPTGSLWLPRDLMHLDEFDPEGRLTNTVYGGLFPTTDFALTPAGGVALREFQNGSRIRVFTPAETARLAPQRPLLHFVDGPFGWATDPHADNVVDQTLDRVGIGRGNPQTETPAAEFRVPGAAGVVQDVTVTWHPVIGSLDSFGIFDPTAIDIDPSTDPRGFAAEALRSGQILFRQSDKLVAPDGGWLPVTKQLQLAGDSTVAFFFTSVSNASYEQFLANPDVLRPPFLSLSIANPGGYDQMLAFVGNGQTLLGFEDLTPARLPAYSDNNLCDEMFSFSVQFTPVPEPASIWLSAMAAAAVLEVGRRRRRATQLGRATVAAKDLELAMAATSVQADPSRHVAA